MGEGVIANLVAFVDNALQELGVEITIEPDDEERRWHLFVLEYLKHLGGIERVRPIVEGQGDLVLICPAPARDHRVERDPALVAHGAQARRAPGEAAHAAAAGEPVCGGPGHARERGAAREQRLGERGLEDPPPAGAARGGEPCAARHRGSRGVEHEPDALAAPALLQRGRELHLPVAARGRFHLALVRLEPAPDEAPPVRRLGRGLPVRRQRLERRLAVPLSVRPAVHGLPVRPRTGARRRTALGRGGHERSSSASFAAWNSMLWLSRCCW